MRNILVIDDERTFSNDGGACMVHCRTVGEALEVLVNIWNHDVMFPYERGIDEIWFDHDLGSEGGDIMVVINWLRNVAEIGHPFPVEQIFVHSQNPVGAKNIVDALFMIYRVKREFLPELV